tara:strand:+ start:96 stop:392 length:297 start_codon:yes stop_codon:yes gene_type:complete
MKVNMENKIAVFDFGNKITACQDTQVERVDSIVLKECTFNNKFVEGYPLFGDDHKDFLNTYSKVVDFSNAPKECEFVSAQVNPDGTTTIFAHSSTPFE